tara:strand:+ start:112167 stop:112676 length:510 start_codon:yes stop_codon:yes gene_type:complete
VNENTKILDQVLLYLAANNLDFNPVFDHFLPDNFKAQLPVFLDQLVKDGFAIAKEIPHPEINSSYGKTIEVYKITNSGLAFQKNSSYVKKERTAKRQQFWTKGKKVAIAINGILLLIIALWNFQIKMKADNNQTELTKEIDSLKAVIKKIETERPALVNTSKNTADSLK